MCWNAIIVTPITCEVREEIQENSKMHQRDLKNNTCMPKNMSERDLKTTTYYISNKMWEKTQNNLEVEELKFTILN